MFQHYDTGVSEQGVNGAEEVGIQLCSVYWELPSFLKHCPNL